MLKGCALNWVLSNDGTRVLFGQNDIGALAAAGATVVRFELRLGARTGWDSTLMASYTTVINTMAAAGLQMIGLLEPGIVYGANQTQWNDNNVENGGSGWNSISLLVHQHHARACGDLPPGQRVGDLERAQRLDQPPQRHGVYGLTVQRYVNFLQRVMIEYDDARAPVSVYPRAAPGQTTTTGSRLILLVSGCHNRN